MAALQTNLEYFIKRGDAQQCLLKLTKQDCCSSYKYLEVVPWRQLQFTTSRKVDRYNSLWSFHRGMMPCACCWRCRKSQSLIFKRENDTQTVFEWRRFVQWKISWLGWDFEMEPLKDSCCSRVQERSISRTWRSGQKTLDIRANCVLKHCFSLETFIPKFVAFFVPLGTVIFFAFVRCRSRSLRQNGSLRRLLFHYPPPRRWTLSISQR